MFYETEAIKNASCTLTPDTASQSFSAVLLTTLLLLCCYVRLQQQQQHGEEEGCKKAVKQKDVRILPGPRCWPIIGSLPSLSLCLHRSLLMLKHRYGDVYQISVGSCRMVVLCSSRVIRHAMLDQADAFSGRPQLYTFTKVSEGKSMAFTSFSPSWKQHRKIAESAIKMAVSANDFMNTYVLTNAYKFTQDLLEIAGESVDPSNAVLWTMANVKYTLCYGDIDSDKESFNKIIRSTLEFIDAHDKGNVANFFPIAKYLLANNFLKLTRNSRTMLGTTRIKERQHLDTHTDGQTRDILDALITLSRKKSAREAGLTQEQVLHTVQEYIGAGLDVSHASLLWCLLLLAAHPHVQRRLQEEIDTILGNRDHTTEANTKQQVPESHELPTEAHKSQMPYMQAFIKETLRFAIPAPFALPHCTTKDAVLDGYYIPKGKYMYLVYFGKNLIIIK